MLDYEQHVFYVFPGQGSQYAGMGSDLHEEFAVARDIYAKAGDVLGYDIAELSFADPEDKLNLTRYTQPALLTHSVACLEVFRELTDDRLRPAIAAGHSLGEYTALVAAGILSFEDALKLVQKRGELMGTHGEGEMSAFPLDLETIKPIAEKYRCAVAGCNLPEQTVIGGRSGTRRRSCFDRCWKKPASVQPKRASCRITRAAFTRPIRRISAKASTTSCSTR
jgi:[acyl-carrier-protein] S-malonyltransferase